MRFTILVAALAAVSACSPGIPDSAAGVGFDDYSEYEARRQEREVLLTGASAVPPAGAMSDESTDTSGRIATGTSDNSEDLARETQAALAATRTGTSGTSGTTGTADEPLRANPNNPPPETVESASGISTENDFNAVGDARSIESDAALIARNREQYQVIQPTALPARSGDTGPNIVEYALATNHPVGTKVYNRIGLNKQARFERNCAKYSSADRAQIDFLANGGPNRDKMGLDPDGDGYACAWNPAPFRIAVNG
ncbi:MAG: hypothetical protein RIA08_13365 [Roseovarius sp.]|uniref:hypothetical protein n=1 Tax=Roseovarius sp. TaxID=1486281 RepID=UPI0032EC5814